MMLVYRCSVVLSAALLLAGCKSSEKAIYGMVHSNHSVAIGSLPRLEPVIEQGPMLTTDGAQPDDAPQVFRQELAYHLAEPQDSLTFGYAKLVVTKAEVTRPGKALQAFQMITMMTPSLLGIPLEWYRTKVQAEVQIINSKGDVIGTYAGEGRSKVRVAMYHGYGQSKAPRLSDMQGLRLALDQIRPQLDAAADTLREQLRAAGPSEEVLGTSSATTTEE